MQRKYFIGKSPRDNYWWIQNYPNSARIVREGIEMTFFDPHEEFNKDYNFYDMEFKSRRAAIGALKRYKKVKLLNKKITVYWNLLSEFITVEK